MKHTIRKVYINYNENLIIKESAGTIYLLDLNTGAVETLNSSASFLWNLLRTPKTIEKLTQQLCSEFAVKPMQAKKDIMRFISNQVDKKHLKIRSSTSRS